MDHHAYSDNSGHQPTTQKLFHTLRLMHSFNRIFVYAATDMPPDIWMRLLVTKFLMLKVVLDKEQC